MEGLGGAYLKTAMVCNDSSCACQVKSVSFFLVQESFNWAPRGEVGTYCSEDLYG